MKPENWRKVENLLNAALEIEPSQRRRFLDEIDGDDVRREVESLLAGDEESEKFLASPAVAFSADFFSDDEAAADAFINQKIGSYRIVRELGRGGMGAVYLGERDDGKFTQQVAVKLLKRELNTADIRRRFARERQILAALAHPNIARLLDAGTTGDGLPFLVMEYVEGLPVDAFCAAHKPDLEERLQIFRTVCDAVAFAHRNLIVHRDLKPSNILVTGDGVPKLLDFGISKLLSPEFEAESAHTVTKLGAMTPEYASPEQLRGESVTTATDVYSLGVILYELLTGQRPFEFKKHSAEEIIRAVCETNPERPSSVVLRPSTAKKNRTTQPDEQRTKDKRQKTKPAALRGDLDNIVLKALKKEPNRRYSSVEQFAEDIRRHLADLPVAARPDTLSYRATKFINRNRIAVFAGLLIFLSLVGGVVATIWQARRAEANQIRAEKRFNDVRRLSNALLFELSPKIERLQGATEAREILVKRALEYLDSLAQEAEGDLHLQSELAAAYEKIGDLQGNPSNPNLIDSEAALESYEKARLIRLKLLEKNPDDFEQQRSLAENYRVSGKIRGQANDTQTEAENLEKALQVYEKLLAGQSGAAGLKLALAQVVYDIGKNRTDGKKYSESFPHFERAIAMLEKINQENPNQSDVLKLLADCHIQFAHALSWEEKQNEAETQAAKAIQTLEPAVANNPNDTNLRAGLWTVYWYASVVYEEQNDNLSHEYALKALKIVEETVRQDAANIRAKQQLAKSFSRLGQTSTNTGKPQEAVSYLENARRILSEIIEGRSKYFRLKAEMTTILMRLGEARAEQGLLPDALADFEKAAEIHQDILQNFPADIRTPRNLALTYESIAETHEKIAGKEGAGKRLSHREKARENFQKALDILLQLDAQNSLSELDRKFLDRVKAAVKNYE
ncbi:MAG TPA: protein kinase [Pyrinomonadaceae bacterium]